MRPLLRRIGPAGLETKSATRTRSHPAGVARWHTVTACNRRSSRPGGSAGIGGKQPAIPLARRREAGVLTRAYTGRRYRSGRFSRDGSGLGLFFPGGFLSMAVGPAHGKEGSMASDSTRFVGHPTAANDPSGVPNSDGDVEGGFDASGLFDPVFDRGASTAGGGPSSGLPPVSAPGSERLTPGKVLPTSGQFADGTKTTEA